MKLRLRSAASAAIRMFPYKHTSVFCMCRKRFAITVSEIIMMMMIFWWAYNFGPNVWTQVLRSICAQVCLLYTEKHVYGIGIGVICTSNLWSNWVGAYLKSARGILFSNATAAKCVVSAFVCVCRTHFVIGVFLWRYQAIWHQPAKHLWFRAETGCSQIKALANCRTAIVLG